MGESDRYIEYRDKHRPQGVNFNINSPVVLLIIFNISVFLFIKVMTFGQITGDTSVTPFFTSKLHLFLAAPTFKEALSQPWSFITYSFFHYSFLTLLSNMLWLWCFGSILQSIVGNRHTFPVYLYGAVAGAVVFIITWQFATPLQGIVLPSLFGANAAVMAIAVAATAMAPNFKILQQLGGGIPIWILTAIYLVIDIAGMGSATGTAFYASHLAGALIGLLYIVSYKRGYDWGKWMNSAYYWFMNLFNPNKKAKKTSVKEKVFYNTGNRAPYHKTAHITQQRVDEILDKISQKGVNHLTEEERNILKRAGEEGL